MTSKVCPSCQIELPLSSFGRNKARIESYCKQCRRDKAKSRSAESRRDARRREAERLGKDYAPRDERKIQTLARKKKVEPEVRALRRIAARVKRAAERKPWQCKHLSHTESRRLRYKIDPEFNIKERLRRQVNKQRRKDGYADLMRRAINAGGESPSMTQALGYTIAELKSHLEARFTTGMNWDEFMKGRIHIDHIKPVAAHNLKDATESASCWAIANLQPLWASDNLKKSAKW